MGIFDSFRRKKPEEVSVGTKSEITPEEAIARNDVEKYIKKMQDKKFWKDPQAALDNVNKMGIEPEIVVATLTRLFKSSYSRDDYPLRVSLLRLIGTYGERASSAVPLLIEVASEVSSLPDCYAYEVGGSVEQRAAALVLATLVNPEYPQSECEFVGLVSAIIAGTGAAGIEEVIKCLSHQDGDVVLQTVRMLRPLSLQAQNATPHLISMLGKSKEKMQRELLITLGFIRHSTGDADTALKACLDDQNEDIRTVAQRVCRK